MASSVSLEELLAKVKELYEQNAFGAIIELLEQTEGVLEHYELGLELARAYINQANALAGSDGEDLYMQANALLDRYALDGKDHATYLFYKGYALFKLGLVNDASLRFERALRFIKLGVEDGLMPTIERMLSLCKSLDPDNNFMRLKPEDEAILDNHIKEHFGAYQILFKTDRYELLHIAPQKEEGRDFNLIITKGLSGRKLKVPQGVDELTDSRVELAICLPAAWEFSNSEGYNIWPINTLCELINFILTTDEFVGFGYSFSQGKKLHQTTDFSGGMLTAMGAYPRRSQEVALSDNSLVHFFELVFLYPMELAFRQNHTALELLELFESKHTLPSPVRKRQDVCAVVSNAQKI